MGRIIRCGSLIRKEAALEVTIPAISRRRNGDVEVVPITEVIQETRRVPKELYELTRVFV